jgi:hypothetical protein
MFIIKKTDNGFSIECDNRDMYALNSAVCEALNSKRTDPTDVDLINQLANEIDKQDI